MEGGLLVPAGFDVPQGLVEAEFVLERLGPQHNEADYAAWTSSMDHIRATPGFSGRTWPRAMSVDDNLGDLESHARDFEARTGFTYTVLDPSDRTVIGCVYIYPSRLAFDASVRSWVRAESAHLDAMLWRAVTVWLERHWPFSSVDYADRIDKRAPA